MLHGELSGTNRMHSGGWPALRVAKAKEFPGKDYDFVAVFDCLHDEGDPVGARRARPRCLEP